MKRIIPKILDGAMGTELAKRDVDIPLPLWSADANVTHPNIVKDIHIDYIKAGADIITTNTFRTTSYSYQKAGYSPQRARERAHDSLRSAVEMAQIAAGDSTQIVGSITSIDDCYSPELFPGKGAAQDTYGEVIEWFNNSGINHLIFETMGHLEEIQIALEMSQNAQMNLWVSLILKNGTQIRNGESIEETVNLIKKYSVSCLLINCNRVETIHKGIDNFLTSWRNDWGVYPNLGKTDFDNDYFELINSDNFGEAMLSYLDLSPSVIGACCGSTPEHIHLLKKLLTNKDKNEIKNQTI
jgi:homocysteine S-methyltransferase